MMHADSGYYFSIFSNRICFSSFSALESSFGKIYATFEWSMEFQTNI